MLAVSLLIIISLSFISLFLASSHFSLNAKHNDIAGEVRDGAIKCEANGGVGHFPD
jgi:hypothetical protein